MTLIVEEDTFLEALLHYVHLNPVRAKLTDVVAASWMACNWKVRICTMPMSFSGSIKWKR